MSLLTLIQEVWRFIEQHLKKFIIGAILGSVLVLAARYTLGLVLMNQQDDSYQYLQNIYSQEPAEFQVIISLDDGQIFTNSNIYDEYLSSSAVVEKIEEKTGLSFGRWITDERNLELREEGSFRGGLAAVRDSSSDLITFRVLVGQNKEENLKIAQAYVDFLTSPDMAFKDIHNIQITHEPEIIELLNLDRVQNVPTNKTLNLYAGMTPKNIVVFTVLGFIVGLILMFLWSIYRTLSAKTINFAFEYSWDMDDEHILIHNRQAFTENLKHLIEFPYVNHRYILLQDGLEDQEQLLLESCKPEQILNDIKQVDQGFELPNEIVMIVKSHETFKKWYKNQYQLVKRMKVPVKIIHRID